MIIRKIAFYSLRVPLHTPFKTAIREVSHIHDLVVKITGDNGLLGFGSAPSTPQITGDSHASMISAIENALKPLVINQSLTDFDEIVNAIHQHPHAGTNAKAALDIALFDAKARSKGLALNAYLQTYTAHTRPALETLETDYTISVNQTKQMCADIDTALARNYRCLKIKIGKNAQEDLARIRSIWSHVQSCQQALQDKIVLRLDVNQGWDERTTISILKTLEQEGISFELVEQPLPADDIQGMAKVKNALKTPIMADESAFNLRQVKRLHALGAADIINIKLVKTGGLLEALRIVEYCREHDIVCMIGCMLEGSIGVAAAAHLASAHNDVIRLIDLDGPSLGQYDPITGASTFDNAHIILNKSMGLGISAQQNLEKWSRF